uniref:CTNNB1_binding domain-containing protein n=1 Tax=Macrostomum lignano TaxID=282301 RepID=A0A1I8FB12_9PLAT
MASSPLLDLAGSESTGSSVPESGPDAGDKHHQQEPPGGAIASRSLRSQEASGHVPTGTAS